MSDVNVIGSNVSVLNPSSKSKSNLSRDFIMAEILFEHFDMAISTLWKNHADVAVRIYFKSIAVRPDCRTQLMEAAVRHLINNAVVTTDGLKACAAETGLNQNVLQEIVSGNSSSVAKAAG
jgi:hypothetical protein